MTTFTAPTRDVEFLLFDLYDLESVWRQTPALADMNAELASAIISEGGRIASEVLAPLNQVGDAEGCRLDDGHVVVPSSFKQAFSRLTQGGWLSLSGNPQFGGQGMPKTLSCVLEEMFYGSNSALYLYGSLTIGAAMCIDTHGSELQKQTYLPKLYSGEWTGAMALTEAHAGTDLGLMLTRAEPLGVDRYSISGTKIFISSGDHDMADNIVHLVLARLPDAPAGSKGISLFLVPKYLPEGGERNKLSAGALEHKMGIRGSATCVMNYDGAVGFLIGEPHKGLAAMFTMMNYERLSIGIQGLGLAELAYQNAALYARDRLQGRGPEGLVNEEGPADSILVHPDVRRMLLTIRAYNEAGRAFSLFVAQQLDKARYNDDSSAQALGELLTPVAKAYLSDRSFECAVLAQQVLGGHGYITEWGMEQIVRDARITQIYEGANGIQALDLIGRKVMRDGGARVREFIGEMQTTEVPREFNESLTLALDSLMRSTETIVKGSVNAPSLPGAVSVDYLELLGLVIYAWLWARMVQVAPADQFGRNKNHTARFFYERILPKHVALSMSISADADVVMNLPADEF